MRKLAIFIAAGVLLLLCATPVLANGIPKLPHAFYGSVTLNGAPAPDGTQISATVNIGDIISTQNPVTTSGGSYGISNSYLLVQGYDIPDGATITFHVTNANGTATGGTDTFVAGGGPTEKNLLVTITAPPPSEPSDDGGGGGAPAPTTVVTNLFGTAGSFRTDSKGVVQATIQATSEDGNLTITIPKNTIALDKHGDPLSSLTSAVDVSPPAPLEDTHIIGVAYGFGPDGATFDPAITLTWSYDPDALPEGVAEEDLVIAYYDESADEWVELECTVDTENNVITASVAHFTSFAIIGTVAPLPAPAAFSVTDLSVKPAAVQPKEAVAITVSVANTGGTEGSYTVVLKINGVKEAEKSVTIAAGGSQKVTFSITREEPGSYTVTIDGLSGSFTVAVPPVVPPPAPTKPPINWPVLGGIIAAVVVVGLLIFFLVRRRAA